VSQATLTLPQAAEKYGISPEHARRLAATGQLPGAFRLGRRVLVSIEGSDRFLADPFPLVPGALRLEGPPLPGHLSVSGSSSEPVPSPSAEAPTNLSPGGGAPSPPGPAHESAPRLDAPPARGARSGGGHLEQRSA
jgi:hypothetical protein